MKKKLFKGTFNWNGEVLVLFNYATTNDIAFSYFIARLSNEIGFNRSFVSNYFTNPEKDNWKIEEVKK